MQIYNNYTLFEIAPVKNCERTPVPLSIAIFDCKLVLHVSSEIEFAEL